MTNEDALQQHERASAEPSSADPARTSGSTLLVTGASGYLGGRLAPQLLAAGYQVRCMVRSAEGLSGHPWHKQVEVAVADALEPASVGRRSGGD